MASSQRQKKRHAQLKKKKFDQRDPKYHRRTTSAQAEEKDRSEEEAKTLHEEHEARPEERVTYSSFTPDIQYDDDTLITDDGENVDEELLEKRLAQLLSARLPPSQPVTLLEEEDNSPDMTHLMPSIDLHDLAQSISSLAMHRRLFIDEEMVKLCERGNTYRHETVADISGGKNQLPTAIPEISRNLLAPPINQQAPPTNQWTSPNSQCTGISSSHKEDSTAAELSDLLQQREDNHHQKKSKNSLPLHDKEKPTKQEKSLETDELDMALDELLDM